MSNYNTDIPLIVFNNGKLYVALYLCEQFEVHVLIGMAVCRSSVSMFLQNVNTGNLLRFNMINISKDCNCK